MGLLDFMSGDTPQRNVVDYDPYAKELMANNIKEAMTPVEDRYQSIDQNLGMADKTYGMLNGVGDAIKQKYQNALTKDVGNLRASERQKQRDMQVGRLQKAQHAVAAKMAVQNDAYSAVMEADTMRESARSSAISSILGLGAGIGGYALAMKGKPQSPSVNATGNYSEDFRNGILSSDSKGYSQSQAYRQNLLGISNRNDYSMGGP